MSFNNIASSAAPPTSLATILPDNAAVSYSDYCAVVVTPAAATFTRPTADILNFQFTNPGARVRFSTDSASVVFAMQWTDLLLTTLYNGIGTVLVDGVAYSNFSRPFGAPGQVSYLINFGTTTQRVIELVLPYCASVEFNSVSVIPGSSFTAAPARSAVRYVAAGDSITQGFFVNDQTKSWNYKLGVLKNWQCINHGYGGRVCTPADGTTVANLAPDVVTYLIGYNDFGGQVPLATFNANFTSFINNFRAVAPAVKLYCITPIYTTTVLPITIESYRQEIRNALSTLANPLNVLIEGPSIMTTSPDRLTDGIHPSDLGASEMATNLAPIVVL